MAAELPLINVRLIALRITFFQKLEDVNEF
jgi:hypothetical protein